MKKIYKIIITCIVFFIIITKSYATTDILPENKFGIKKATILGAGVFLVVQILFITYRKDKIKENNMTKNEKKTEEILNNKDLSNPEKNIEEFIFEIEEEKDNTIDVEELSVKAKDSKIEEKEEDILSAEELEKIEKENKKLFETMKIKTEIETLPDIMSPKKRNIKLKNENDSSQEKKKNTPENKTKIVSRNSVKIVRERKDRNINEDIKKETTKLDVEAKKRKTKLEGQEKKKITKAYGEAKKQEVKAETKVKKNKTKNKHQKD